MPAKDSIARAEWLLTNYSIGHYDLAGNNCEHMAIFAQLVYTPKATDFEPVFGVVASIIAAGL